MLESKNFPLLNLKSTYSLMQSSTKPYQNIIRAVKNGFFNLCISDISSISGCIQHIKACKDACECGYPSNQHVDSKGRCLLDDSCEKYTKGSIKPILGCDILTKQGRLLLICKNLEGWRTLIKLVSKANENQHQIIDLEEIAKIHNNNLFVLSGEFGTEIGNCIFSNSYKAYLCSTESEVKRNLVNQCTTKLLETCNKYKNMFGDNFYLQINCSGQESIPIVQVINDSLRWVSENNNFNTAACPSIYYPSEDDSSDQRVLLSILVNCPLSSCKNRLESDINKFDLSKFFKSNDFKIPDLKTIHEKYTKKEICGAIFIGEECKNYEVTSKPKIPEFKTPDNKNPDDYILELCRNGWKEKIAKVISKEKHKEYAERVKYEYKIIKEAGLSSYFLIVHDYVEYSIKVLKCPKSRGRGSAAGSLVSYLLGITNVDPILYGLSFERFYNAARNTPGNISLPDIDCDFPTEKRIPVKEYIKNKYGPENVCSMATYSRLQGREALTCVLKAHEWGNFEEIKRITEIIPDESKIADKLQEMREEYGEASILAWCLENYDKELEDYAKYNQDGKIEGPLSRFFEQAIRLEGSKRNRGKHPAAIIISPDKISDIAPIMFDGEDSIELFEMADAEAIGMVKMDLLGLSCLSKIAGTANSIRTGRVGMA